MCADREDIAADREQSPDLAKPAGDPEKPRDCKGPAGDEDDVLARDRQEVVEARDPEPLPELFGEALLVTEHDAFNHSTAFAVQAGCDRASHGLAQPVGDAPQTATVSDELPPVGAQDDMDAMAPQPGALVEAVLGRLREPDCGDSLEQATLRRRAPERQLEQDGLAEAEPTESMNLSRDPQLESRSPRSW